MAEDAHTLDNLPDESEEEQEEHVELNLTEQDIILEDKEDVCIEDPYKGELTSETLLMGDDNIPDSDYPRKRISMM